MNTMINVVSRPRGCRIITIYSSFHTLVFLIWEEMELGTLTTSEEEVPSMGRIRRAEESAFLFHGASGESPLISVCRLTCSPIELGGKTAQFMAAPQFRGAPRRPSDPRASFICSQPDLFKPLTPIPLASQLRVNNCQGLLITFRRAYVKQVPFSHTKYVILMASSVC